MNHTPPEPTPPKSTLNAKQRGVASSLLTIAVVVGVFLVVAGSFIVAQVIPNRAVFDQRHYHQPTIEAFAKDWPSIDVWDYLSATTPGYHWVLAGFVKVFGAGVAGLQVVSMTISAGLFALLGWMVSRGMGSQKFKSGTQTTLTHPQPLPGGGTLKANRFTFAAALLCLPILCCSYFMVGGIALLPDNAGWLGVCAMLALALHAKSMRVLCGVGGLALLALVLTRQVHVWTGGLLVLAAWLGVASDANQRVSFDFSAKRFARAAVAVVACVPAIIGVALFVRYWGGLVPPRFQMQYPPKPVSQFFVSPSPAFILCICAIFGIVLCPFWWRGLRALWVRMSGVLGVVIIASLVIAIVPATNFDYLGGRRTGLWNLTQHFPVLFDRTSVLIAGLAPIGGVVLASFFVSLHERGKTRDAILLLATLGGYALVLTASNEVWQRYVEPLVLVVMMLMCARVGFTPLTSEQVLEKQSFWHGTLARRASVVALSIALLAITFKTMSVGLEKLSDPPPPPITADHIGPTPPVLLPRPEKPVGKLFW
ncbi:MAG: hypothetical protein U0640_09610 [Phycisphaerales bacterium]